MSEPLFPIHEHAAAQVQPLDPAFVAQRALYEQASRAYFDAHHEHGPAAGETRMAAAEQQAYAAPLVRESSAPDAVHKADVLVHGDLFARALVPRLLIHCLDRRVLDVAQTLPYWRRTLDDPVPYVSQTTHRLVRTFASCTPGDATRRQLWTTLRLGVVSVPRF